MKTYRKELFFNIPKRRGLVNITDEGQQGRGRPGPGECHEHNGKRLHQ